MSFVSLPPLETDPLFVFDSHPTYSQTMNKPSSNLLGIQAKTVAFAHVISSLSNDSRRVYNAGSLPHTKDVLTCNNRYVVIDSITIESDAPIASSGYVMEPNSPDRLSIVTKTSVDQPSVEALERSLMKMDAVTEHMMTIHDRYVQYIAHKKPAVAKRATLIMDQWMNPIVSFSPEEHDNRLHALHTHDCIHTLAMYDTSDISFSEQQNAVEMTEYLLSVERTIAKTTVDNEGHETAIYQATVIGTLADEVTEDEMIGSDIDSDIHHGFDADSDVDLDISEHNDESDIDLEDEHADDADLEDDDTDPDSDIDLDISEYNESMDTYHERIDDRNDNTVSNDNNGDNQSEMIDSDSSLDSEHDSTHGLDHFLVSILRPVYSNPTHKKSTRPLGTRRGYVVLRENDDECYLPLEERNFTIPGVDTHFCFQSYTSKDTGNSRVIECGDHGQESTLLPRGTSFFVKSISPSDAQLMSDTIESTLDLEYYHYNSGYFQLETMSEEDTDTLLSDSDYNSDYNSELDVDSEYESEPGHGFDNEEQHELDIEQEHNSEQQTDSNADDEEQLDSECLSSSDASSDEDEDDDQELTTPIRLKDIVDHLDKPHSQNPVRDTHGHFTSYYATNIITSIYEDDEAKAERLGLDKVTSEVTPPAAPVVISNVFTLLGMPSVDADVIRRYTAQIDGVEYTETEFNNDSVLEDANMEEYTSNSSQTQSAHIHNRNDNYDSIDNILDLEDDDMGDDTDDLSDLLNNIEDKVENSELHPMEVVGCIHMLSSSRVLWGKDAFDAIQSNYHAIPHTVPRALLGDIASDLSKHVLKRNV